MAKLTEFQTLLVGCLNGLKLDKAAILFIMLTLKSEDAQGAFALYLRDNPEATQEELMEVADEMQRMAEEME